MTPKLYKAADVCEMAQLQPFVLRSWEREFPGIGVQKSAESPRLYRQSDVDQLLKIKQLVIGEGLTLAGARRRLEAELPAAAVPTEREGTAEVLETLGADARAKIATVRRGLRLLLDGLSARPGAITASASAGGYGEASAEAYELRPPVAADRGPKAGSVKARAIAARGKPARVAAKPAGGKATNAKRKRASA